MQRSFLSLFLLLAIVVPALGKTWHVGPTRTYTAPSQVMALVGNGDTVEIDAGLYSGDVGTWYADSLVLRCPIGMAHLEAAGKISQRKGIWVIDGKHTYVEGIEFSGAAISEADGDNGAGIRLQGLGFECRRCYFHDNQEGILTGNDTTNEVLIEACEFNHNGVETGAAAGFQHNIYVGHSRSCTIKFCYFHRSIIGHEVKTRANRNYILYNYIVDDTDGDGSYSIDMPNGGESYVIGNSIEKGPKTANSTVIDYGAEGIINPDSNFYFGNNTVVTDRTPTTFFNIRVGAHATIMNNLFAGATHLLGGIADTISNIISDSISYFHFVEPSIFRYVPIDPPFWYDTVARPDFVKSFPLLPLSFAPYPPMDSETINFTTFYHPYLGALPYVFLTGSVKRAAQGFYASRNFPNPFNRTTNIHLPSSFAEGGTVIVSVYSLSGDFVSRSICVPRDNRIDIDRGSLPTGVYHYRITTEDGSEVATGSMVIFP